MDSSWLTGLYCQGLGLTSQLQHHLSEYHHHLVMFSHLGDPRYAFLVLFPYAYAIDNMLGLQVVWLASLTEWLNAILKWIARDDRPYWWHDDKCDYSGMNLRQFSITCESGPGFPSGHVMSTSSLALLLILYVRGALKDTQMKRRVTCVGAVLFMLLITLVSLSRVFIATHFPHQVVVGAVVGMATAVTVYTVASRGPPTYLLNKKSFLIGGFLLAVALALFQLLSLFELNPMSSVNLALRHCERREWVHVDTTLFFAVVRDIGSLCGVALSAVLLNWSQRGRVWLRNLYDKSPIETVGSMVLGVALSEVIRLGEQWKLPQEDINVFYFLAAAKYMVMVCFVILGEYAAFRCLKVCGIGKNYKTE